MRNDTVLKNLSANVWCNWKLLNMLGFVCVYSSQNETRFAVDLNNFGFFPNGTLDVNLHSLRLTDKEVNYSTYPVSKHVCVC